MSKSNKIRNPHLREAMNKKIEPPSNPPAPPPPPPPPPVPALEEHEITANISLPKEGGWGWVVVAASFSMIFVLDGMIYTFGSLMVDMAEDFQETNTLMSLVNSVTTSLYLLASPLASAFINRFGFRQCAMIGSIICSFSLLASFFSNRYAYLMLFYGVLAGIGCALINMSASLVVGFYFEKLRALAMSITNSGSSFGVMLFFPLNSYLVSLAGWRATTLFHSALFGMCFFFGMAFRPLLTVSVAAEEEGLPIRSVIYLPSVSAVATRPPTTSLSTMQTANANARLRRALSNAHFPTAAAIIESSGEPVTTVASSTAPSTSRDTGEVTQEKKASRMVVTPYIRSATSHRHINQVKSIASAVGVVVKMPSPGAEGLPQFEATPERPLYRDDAFYDGNIKRLPEYQKNVVEGAPEGKTGLEYQLAVTRTASLHDIEERRGVFTTAVRRVLATMMDPALLKSQAFRLICISGFCFSLGMYVPYVYLRDRSIHAGMDPTEASILMSVMAGSNTAGRLGLGIAAAKINPLSLYAAGITIAGISTMLSSLSYSSIFQFFYAIVFGFNIAAATTLRSLCLVELYGIEKLTNATGVSLIFLGLGTVMGAPLAGLIQAKSGSYVVPFVVAGGFVTAGGIIMIYVKIKTKESKLEKVKGKEKPKRLPQVQGRRSQPETQKSIPQAQTHIPPKHESIASQTQEKPNRLDILDPERYEKYLQEKQRKKLISDNKPYR